MLFIFQVLNFCILNQNLIYLRLPEWLWHVYEFNTVPKQLEDYKFYCLQLHNVRSPVILKCSQQWANVTNNKTTNIPYLNITKYSNASGSYDDGIYITFNSSMPKHISFQMWTEDPNIETCDIRLTSIVMPDTNTNLSTTPAPPPTKTTTKTPVGPFVGNFTKVAWQDVVFFRFGYFNYQKMNLVSMVNPFVS